MPKRIRLTLLLLAIVALIPGLTQAKNEIVYTFSAPPRETPEAGQAKYKPVAEYLSQVIGKKVVYEHPGNWGVYRSRMLKGEYDIVFDGPHFNGYRAAKMNHNIVAKIPKGHQFVVIVRKSNTRFKSLSQMGGRTFCTHAPPNLGTLTLLREFKNPSRQPVIVNTKGWSNIYVGVQTGRCTAGILPIINLEKLDRNLQFSKIIFQARKLPNQAFSIGPRISKADQRKITQALIGPNATEPTTKLRLAYNVGSKFVPTTNKEYLSIAEFLKNEWGYY